MVSCTCRYEGCHDAASYDGVSCSTLEQTCYACYCSIAVESFAAMKYCSPYWADYILQVHLHHSDSDQYVSAGQGVSCSCKPEGRRSCLRIVELWQLSLL